MARTLWWQSATDTVNTNGRLFHLHKFVSCFFVFLNFIYQIIARLTLLLCGTRLRLCLLAPILLHNTVVLRPCTSGYKLYNPKAAETWFYLLSFLCWMFRNLPAVQNRYIWGLHLWNRVKTRGLQDSQVWETGCGVSQFGGGEAH